jgi:sporulation-control protein spo0M
MSSSLWSTERAWDEEGFELEEEVDCVERGDEEGFELEEEVDCVARGEEGWRETGWLDVGIEIIRLTAGDGV